MKTLLFTLLLLNPLYSFAENQSLNPPETFESILKTNDCVLTLNEPILIQKGADEGFSSNGLVTAQLLSDAKILRTVGVKSKNFNVSPFDELSVGNHIYFRRIIIQSIGLTSVPAGKTVRTMTIEEIQDASGYTTNNKSLHLITIVCSPSNALNL